MALTGHPRSGHGKQSGRPLVKAVVTDADLDPEAVQLKPLNMDDIVKFFDVPLSQSLIMRHIKVLKKVAKHFIHGVPLKDLPKLIKILQICAAHIEEHKDFIDPVCDIISLLSLAFLKEKTSEEVKYFETTAKSLWDLGYLMQVPSAQVRMQICATVKDFYSAERPKLQIIGFQPTSSSYKIRTAEKSGLAETLVSSLTIMENDLQEKLSLMRTLQLLSTTNENCMFMARAQAAARLCSHLDDPDPSGQLLFLSSGILFNLLDLGPKDDVINQMNNMDCICALRDCVVRLLTTGYKDHDRQLRNDLLGITTVIAESSPSLIIDSGFAKQLILFATFPEIKSRNPLVRNVRLLHNHEGLKMKRMLMNLLVVLSKDRSSATMFSDGKVMSALFTYVKPIEKPEMRDWPTSYFEELQLQAISTLSSVAPRLVEDYMACEGNKRILQFLQWCCSQDVFVRKGNRFYATGCRGTKIAQTRQSLRLLQSMVSVQDDALNKDLCDQGAVRQLLGILKMTNTGADEKDEFVTTEIQSEILSILSSLCDTDPHTKDLFGSEEVDVIVQLLRMDPAKIHSGLGHDKLILSTLTCVWSYIAGYSTTEDDFLTKQGMFPMLDLLAVNWTPMNTLLLTILDTLCENPKARSHIYNWRGKNCETAPRLLVQLWKQAEEELGEVRDEYGRIIDGKNPLGRQLQKDPEVAPISPHSFTPVTSKVAEIRKSKIHSIFSKLGVKNLPGLCTLDYVTLSAIVSHLDFMARDFTREIGKDNIQPRKYNKDFVNFIKNERENVARRVIAEQSKIIEEHQKMELLEEQQRYAVIIANMKQRENTQKKWDDFVARTSNHEVLKEAKQRKEDLIELSRPEYRPQKGIFHATEVYGLNTTVSCSRVVHVKSTPSEFTDGPIKDSYFVNKRLQFQRARKPKIHKKKTNYN